MATSPAVSPLKDAVRALFSDPRDKAFIFALEGALIRPDDAEGARIESDELTELLGDLERASDGAVAILSDRPLETVDRILAPLRLPGCGRNGLEIRVPGEMSVKMRLEADLDPVRRLICAAAPLPQALTIVDEGLAIALRHDGDPDLAAMARNLARDAIGLAPAVYRAQMCEKVTRVTFTGASKGRAIRKVMSSDFFIERIPVVFGCDNEDDEVYSAVRNFGGTAIQVGSRQGHEADIVVPGSNDVKWLIRDFLADLSGKMQ